MGIDKGLVQFRGRPLVEHVIERIRPQVSELLLNAPERPQWQSMPYRRMPDQIPGGLGPLAGLHAGMVAARTRWLLCVPCDTPFLPPDLASRLRGWLTQREAPAVMAVTGGQTHPAISLVDATLADQLEAWIKAGGRRMGEWMSSIGAGCCNFPDPERFANLNTPDELRRLERP